ncbi:MAG: putative glycolipid-binding domain-containing protein [Candidatus Limnocylindria bacterium]
MTARPARAILWMREDGYGCEFCEVALGGTRLDARGVAVAVDPLPYRLDYELATGEAFVTKSLLVRSSGAAWSRELRLERDADGTWHLAAEQRGEVDLPRAGGDAAAFEGADDCDLGRSPLTNTMPVLRARLLEGGAAEFLMAWVSAPDLGVHTSRQRYEFLSRDAAGAVVRYRGSHRGTAYDIEFDADGLVRRYPGLAYRACESLL